MMTVSTLTAQRKFLLPQGLVAVDVVVVGVKAVGMAILCPSLSPLPCQWAIAVAGLERYRYR